MDETLPPPRPRLPGDHDAEVRQFLELRRNRNTCPRRTLGCRTTEPRKSDGARWCYTCDRIILPIALAIALLIGISTPARAQAGIPTTVLVENATPLAFALHVTGAAGEIATVEAFSSVCIRFRKAVAGEVVLYARPYGTTAIQILSPPFPLVPGEGWHWKLSTLGPVAVDLVQADPCGRELAIGP
jgi:hypothetical protein